MTSPLVVAVVLNWNLGEVTVRCVERLRSSTYPRLQVVVVDNGSSDGSVEQLRATFSDVDVVAISENRGYAEGVNVGIRHALALGAEWVLLVNNDAEVAPGAITKLVAAAGSTIGLVTPRIDALPSGRLWHAGARTSRLTLLPYELGPAELAKGRTLCVDYATGCVLLIHRQVFERIGLFDERYFMYYEDLGFSTRARAAGFPILVVPETLAWHHVGGSLKKDPPRRTRLQYRHRVIWCRSQPPGLAALAWWLSLLYATERDLVIALLRGDAARARAIVDGLRDGFRERSVASH
jgi:GT2 family glycosyltransferase